MTTRFVHLRAVAGPFDHIDHKGGATVAYDIVANNDGSPEKIVYALALCEERDVYNKERGRMISEGRLLNKRGKRVHVLTYRPGTTVREQVIRDIESRSEVLTPLDPPGALL